MARRLRTTLTMAAGLTLACTQSPTGQPQLRLVSDSDMAKMGVQAFDEVKAETPESKSAELNAYVQCVARAITSVAAPNEPWEVRVFESPEVNAFALPGGKIGVYTGILGVAQNQDQLAAILGHEVSHVLAHHGNARVSAAMATEAGLEVGSMVAGKSQTSRDILGLLGVGAQVGVLMPYGREQETEADVLGLELMAKSGFEPKGAVDLWENMKRASTSQPPTFLSTHPSHEGRIRELSARLPKAEQQYEAARSNGRAPQCPRPGSAEHAAR